MGLIFKALTKNALSVVVLAAFGSFLGSPAQAQNWPTKPVKLVVPFPPGGGADIVARLLAQGLTERWGQQVVIENKPGANTILAAEQVARATPDGYTLLMAMDTTLTQNQFLFGKLPYDPITDFAPISMVVAAPVMMVASERFKGNFGDWISAAKSNPGKLNYGVSGVSTQLVAAIIEEAAQISAQHISYKGSAPTAQGLIAGDVDIAFDGIAPYLQFIKSGKARALAVTSAQRSSALPDVATINELGLRNLDLKVWFAIVAPKGTSSEIVNRVRGDLVEVLSKADIRQRLGTFAFEPVGSTPQQLTATIEQEVARYGPIIKRLGIKLD
jgi:tripartite-type tricarboxylate transporter receptor subunit TctC